VAKLATPSGGKAFHQRQVRTPTGRPHEGECGSEEEASGPGIGPVVDARGIDVGLVKDRHQQGRHRRARERDEQRVAAQEHHPDDE
jgi:hypothetical protein